jgi:glucokinase
MRKIAIGVDIGGSHVSCAACNIEEKIYLSETFSENEVDNQGTVDEILGVWSKTIQRTIEKVGIENVKGIGFAMPGPFDYAKGIALFKGDNKKYENIYELNVPDALREILCLPHNFPIRFINDATAFAIGESWIGKANGAKQLLAITLGTGFGSAFMKEGIPVVSGPEVPEIGCLWHLTFGSGIADDYFSTRGLLNRYYEITGIMLSGVKELAQLADVQMNARMLFDDFGSKLGIFLHPWMETFGVEVLVIGGNISNAFSLFKESMKSYLKANGSSVRIEVSELKESASLVGSAVLLDTDYFENLKSLIPLMSKLNISKL